MLPLSRTPRTTGSAARHRHLSSSVRQHARRIRGARRAPLPTTECRTHCTVYMRSARGLALRRRWVPAGVRLPPVRCPSQSLRGQQRETCIHPALTGTQPRRTAGSGGHGASPKAGFLLGRPPSAPGRRAWRLSQADVQRLTCVHPCCEANVMPEQHALDHQPTRPSPGGAFNVSGGDLAEAAGSMMASAGAARPQPLEEGDSDESPRRCRAMLHQVGIAVASVHATVVRGSTGPSVAETVGCSSTHYRVTNPVMFSTGI